MTELEEKIGYTFTDSALLKAALTHPSLSRGKGGGAAYERLEFLGDRVLSLVMAEWLYRLYPAEAEGLLAKRHAALVSAATLERVGEATGIAQSLRLTSGGADSARQNLAAFSDAVESVIGALYLDGGLAPARAFIESFWQGEVADATVAPIDPKSALQEWTQGRGLPLPVYFVVERSGPAHAPVFKIRVEIKGASPVEREGNSKREAEKAAAEALLESIAAQGSFTR